VSGNEAPTTASAKQDSRNLLLRVLTAAVMAPLAVAIVWAGGWLWAVLVVAAAIAMYVEWLLIVGDTPRFVAVFGVGVLLAVGICLALGQHAAGLALVIVGLLGVAWFSRQLWRWIAGGLLYAAVALIASILLRHDAAWGFTALMFVLLVVWATDIGGYFAGRGIGGPKLWVRVSPKKTWAGAVGGLLGSLIVAAGFAMSGLGKTIALLLLGVALSVVSQFGDLFESAVKRRFGVKDSSNIIPGHGGVLDRLDGFVAAIAFAALIGTIRGGVDGVARGLMVWGYDECSSVEER